MIQGRVSHISARQKIIPKINTTSIASEYNRVTRNAVGQNSTGIFFRASIVVLCYKRAPDFHSAVIAHSSFKLCLFGGELVFRRYQKIRSQELRGSQR